MNSNSNQKTRVAILMTCFNRAEKTIRCLSQVYASNKPADCTFSIYLVDDGSTDGTSEKVSQLFPHVKIINGTGNLYWSGGMRLAWLNASENDYDHYIWLNDDTFIFKESLSTLLMCANKSNNDSIICSTVVSEKTNKITYGGKLKSEKNYRTPNGTLQACEIICGNCVLVPRKIFKSIGAIDKIFIHAIGDCDYGLRAIKNGFYCYIASEIIGTCESNPSQPAWCRKDVSIKNRILSLYSPLGYAQPLPYFIYVSRHFGLASAIKQLVSAHVRLLIPSLWDKK